MITTDNSVPDVAAFQKQIDTLCKEHDIKVRETPVFLDSASSFLHSSVKIPKVRSTVSYATCLHEIGHSVLEHINSDDGHSMERERAAWDWAQKNALVWTPEMEEMKYAGLTSHEIGERKRKEIKILAEFLENVEKDMRKASKNKVQIDEATAKAVIKKSFDQAEAAFKLLGTKAEIEVKSIDVDAGKAGLEIKATDELPKL